MKPIKEQIDVENAEIAINWEVQLNPLYLLNRILNLHFFVDLGFS